MSEPVHFEATSCQILSHPIDRAICERRVAKRRRRARKRCECEHKGWKCASCRQLKKSEQAPRVVIRKRRKPPTRRELREAIQFLMELADPDDLEALDALEVLRQRANQSDDDRLLEEVGKMLAERNTPDPDEALLEEVGRLLLADQQRQQDSAQFANEYRRMTPRQRSDFWGSLNKIRRRLDGLQLQARQMKRRIRGAP